ncbi:aminotransferase class I/II-fold pyridoxal phosphate-dependent enzyme [Sorangium sp. So ce341]|uniref:aminotransferase class I/II-fold pyridoxal phosphate-dependent enzyme n=1 Tax=Sorangium sp. So ce341 TaxID=3133302 RepID=UPI003F5D76C7
MDVSGTCQFARATNSRLPSIGDGASPRDPMSAPLVCSCVEALSSFGVRHRARSHQFPTGALLPLKRRVKFLELAAPAEGLVLEDDDDSEFRFRGSPVPPLASLDAERVVYLGTFSKCLAPFVRVGYLIAPPHLVGPIADLVRRTNLRGSTPHQRTLARFIEEGHLERHIFAMKRRYRARLPSLRGTCTSRGRPRRPSAT